MKQGKIRIIGGKFRGRQLKVPPILTVRPTPDRVRETVFNWLAPVISGAYCLDAFAGSGACGFEALSRGASFVVMVDQSREVIQLLKEELQTFKVDNAKVYQATFPLGLQKPERTFDIVFLDPPFKDDQLSVYCHYLEDNEFLSSEAYIYLEYQSSLPMIDLPPHWTLIKSKKAGQVGYHLVHRNNPKFDSCNRSESG